MHPKLRKLKKKLQPYLSNFYAQCVAVFIGTTVSDYVWAKYMGSISLGLPFVAACWAVLVIVLGAFLVVGYVHDKRLIIPAAIGAFIGTYFAV